MSRPAFVALCLLGSLACTPPAPPAGAAPPPTPAAASAGGTLFIVGGGAQPPALLEQFVALAGGPGRARIAVLPMASGAAETSGREKAEQLRGLGAEAFSLNVSRADAMLAANVRRLDSVTGIWFTGGDQARLTPILRDSPLLAAIQARRRAGAVIGGTSAGAAIMSDSMLTGEQIRAGEDTLGYHGDVYPAIARSTIVVVPGLGFLPGTIVDQHFHRRERHNRLLSAVLERPQLLGVGIDEGTAVIVDAHGRWTVSGRSSAVVYDARVAHITAASAPVLGAAGVRLHVLPAGSSYDPRTGAVTLP